jgi:riboflavin-specific deaminase-like protein
MTATGDEWGSRNKGVDRMRRAEVTEEVWAALLELRRGRPIGLDPGWGDDARAAWDLYQPLAADDGAAPYVFAQVGQSLDGRIATLSGDATAISGPDGLRHLHRCRALADAVVVGVRTAISDDPRLTVRLVSGPNPARVVIDPHGRLPNSSRVLTDDGARRLVIQACHRLRPPGVEVVELPATDGWISPASIHAALAEREFCRVLVEGGGVTIAGFLDAGLLQRLHVAISPLIIGAGPSGLRTAPIARLADALRPETHVYGLDSDVVFDCALAPSSASKSQWPIVQPLAVRRA